MTDGTRIQDLTPRALLVYHFCRLQLPSLDLTRETAARHLRRTFALWQTKVPSANWDAYLDNLYPLDWFLAAACLEGKPKAWETLFAARAGRNDCLLLDALRAARPAFMPATRNGKIRP